MTGRDKLIQLARQNLLTAAAVLGYVLLRKPGAYVVPEAMHNEIRDAYAALCAAKSLPVGAAMGVENDSESGPGDEQDD